MIRYLLPVALTLATPLSAQPAPPTEEAQNAVVVAAIADMHAGSHDAAIARLDTLLAAYGKYYSGSKRAVVCAAGIAETLTYLTLAAAAKRDTVAITPGWCDTLFMKGFVLSDAKRLGEAREWIEGAIALRPQYAHYLNELGYVLQAEPQWQASYDAFAKAAANVALSDAGLQAAQKGRALRGMGFALIEQGKWDDAEAKFKEALAVDPDDTKAKNELKYISEQRAKAT